MGRLLALIVAGVAAKEERVTWDEAKCVMEGKSMAMMGDSISRDCYYVFNEFIETGKTYKIDGSNYEDMGESGDSDDDESWTDWKRFSFVKEHHRVYFRKEFEDIDASSEFWFQQKAWSDSSDTGGKDSLADIAKDVAKANYALVNSGWWDLKEDDDADRYCGEDFGKDDCEKDYKADLGKLADQILTKVDVGLFRETSCCGEDGEKWIDAIEDMNKAAKDVMDQKGVGIVEVYDLYDKNNIDDHTTDGKHADPDMCLDWFSIALRKIDAAQDNVCMAQCMIPEGCGKGKKNKKKKPKKKKKGKKNKKAKKNKKKKAKK